MKKKPKAVIDELVMDEDEAFFWDSFGPGDTGLKQKVWFCGPAERKDGRPCGRVRVDHLSYPFSIDEPVQWMVKPAPGVSAKDFAEIARYARLNREAIMAYWNAEICTSDFIQRLQKLNDLTCLGDVSANTSVPRDTG